MGKAWFVLFFFMVVFGLSSFAQDLIVTRTDSIKCKILDVDTVSIEFSYLSNGIVISNTLPISEISDYKYNFFDSRVSGRPIIQEKYPKFRWGVDGGYSRRIGELPEEISSFERDYINKLKSGINFGTDFSYYFGKTWGLGIKYMYSSASNRENNVVMTDHSGNQYYGTLSDHTVLHTACPMFTARTYDERKLNFFNVSAGLGYSLYTNKGEAVVQNIRMRGSSLSSFVELGYDRMISNSIAVGVCLTMLSAALFQYDYYLNNTYGHQSLSAENAENLSRIDISVGLRFLK